MSNQKSTPLIKGMLCAIIVDQYNRKYLEIGINYSLPSRKVFEILEETIHEYGKPLGITTDNGPEFISHFFQNWLKKIALNGSN